MEDIIKHLRKSVQKVKKEVGGGIICFSVKDLADIFSEKITRRSIQRAITTMQKYNEIQAIDIDVSIAKRIYGDKYNRGLQLFFILD